VRTSEIGGSESAQDALFFEYHFIWKFSADALKSVSYIISLCRSVKGQILPVLV